MDNMISAFENAKTMDELIKIIIDDLSSNQELFNLYIENAISRYQKEHDIEMFLNSMEISIKAREKQKKIGGK